jgi:GGDEF domain-containing protein
MAERLSDDLCLKVADTCRSSAGVALWNGRESADELLARADRAMYDVKARRARPAVTAL